MCPQPPHHAPHTCRQLLAPLLDCSASRLPFLSPHLAGNDPSFGDVQVFGQFTREVVDTAAAEREAAQGSRSSGQARPMQPVRLPPSPLSVLRSSASCACPYYISPPALSPAGRCAGGRPRRCCQEPREAAAPPERTVPVTLGRAHAVRGRPRMCAARPLRSRRRP